MKSNDNKGKFSPLVDNGITGVMMQDLLFQCTILHLVYMYSCCKINVSFIDNYTFMPPVYTEFIYTLELSRLNDDIIYLT